MIRVTRYPNSLCIDTDSGRTMISNKLHHLATPELRILYELADYLEKQSAATPGIDLGQFRESVECLYSKRLSEYEDGQHSDADMQAYEVERRRLLSLIDASPKGGSDAAQLLEALKIAREYAAFANAEAEDLALMDAAIAAATSAEGVRVKQNCPPPSWMFPEDEAAPADSVTDWRVKAAEWLEEQAIEQEITNKAYPAHVAAYPSWADCVHWIRTLASKVSESKATSAEVGECNCPNGRAECMPDCASRKPTSHGAGVSE